MLPAIGAVSAALDAAQSLTSPAASSSSQPADAFAPALSGIADSLPASPPNPASISGFGNSRISPDISTLLNAQSLAPSDVGDAFGLRDSAPDSSQTPSISAASAASSAYHSINQLTQSTVLPLGLSPFSVSA